MFPKDFGQVEGKGKRPYLQKNTCDEEEKRNKNYPGNKADPLCSTAKMANSEIMANKVEKIWNTCLTYRIQ